MNRNNSSGIFVDVESAEQSLNPILENDIELKTNINHDDTNENDLKVDLSSGITISVSFV